LCNDGAAFSLSHKHFFCIANNGAGDARPRVTGREAVRPPTETVIVRIRVDHDRPPDNVALESTKAYHTVRDACPDATLTVGTDVSEIAHMTLFRVDPSVVFSIRIEMRTRAGARGLGQIARLVDVHRVRLMPPETFEIEIDVDAITVLGEPDRPMDFLGGEACNGHDDFHFFFS
jgi:hypothetical protein